MGLFQEAIEPVLANHQFSEIIDHEKREGEGDLALAANKTYFGVRLSEMFLKHRSKLGQNFAPKVVSVSNFTYNAKPLQLPVVVSKDLVQAMGRSVGDSVVVFENIPLVRPTPFRGGDVEIFLALHRSDTGNVLANPMSLLGDVAGALGANLEPYKEIAEKVSSGVFRILGDDPENAVFAYLVNISADSLAEKGDHYRVFMDCPDGAVDKDTLFVRNDRLYIKGDDGEERRYEEQNYCLLKFTVRDSRDDYESLPFYRIYEDMMERIDKNDLSGAKDLFTDLKIQVRRSPDLTEPHKSKLKFFSSDK